MENLNEEEIIMLEKILKYKIEEQLETMIDDGANDGRLDYLGKLIELYRKVR